MVLPVLGSFLAPALFPAMNPLLMGAVGSGIGSLMQGDDFGDAIKTGLLSFAGGKLLGGLGKGAVDTTAPTAVSGGKQIDPSSFFKNANPPENMFDPFKAFGEGKKVLGPTLAQGAAMAKANPMMAAGIGGGAALGSALTAPKDTGTDKSDYERTETVPIQDDIRFPLMGYRPGVDPEFNYGFTNPSAGQLQTRVLKEGGMVDYVNPTMLSKGGIATFAAGGDMPDMPAPEGPNEKDIVTNAVNAVKGNLPFEQASVALAMYQKTYGEEALEALIDDVKAGSYDDVGGKMDGQVPGGGDGMSDSVPATIDGQQDLLASVDEYMVDAPTVAMIGNGSSDAGARKLDNFRKKIREEATGSPEQQKQINAEKIMQETLT